MKEKNSNDISGEKKLNASPDERHKSVILT